MRPPAWLGVAPARGLNPPGATAAFPRRERDCPWLARWPACRANGRAEIRGLRTAAPRPAPRQPRERISARWRVPATTLRRLRVLNFLTQRRRLRRARWKRASSCGRPRRLQGSQKLLREWRRRLRVRVVPARRRRAAWSTPAPISNERAARGWDRPFPRN